MNLAIKRPKEEIVDPKEKKKQTKTEWNNKLTWGYTNSEIKRQIWFFILQ